MNLCSKVVLFFLVLVYISLYVAVRKMSYRIRSPLLRTVHQRMLSDVDERGRDHSFWYYIDTDSLSEELCDKFLQSHEDDETKAFLDRCYDKADWVFTQVGHLLSKAFLSWFMTQTSINGLLQRGSMFVFSKQQFNDLLAIDGDWKTGKLLDLGAGDGMVTKQMADHFEKVYVTETSGPMIWRLKEKGYEVLGIEEWCDGTQQYDVISALNLIDRCDRPIKLLNQIRQSLTQGGRLILAVVLPFKPYVEFGGIDHKPFEYLHISGFSFTEQVNNFAKNVFEPAGYTVERFTRLPYLCEGDLEHSYYLLFDVVFVLRLSTTS